MDEVENICVMCPYRDKADLIDEFLKEFNKFNFDQIALRDPPSKHQRELKKLIDLVKSFELLVHKNEGTKE